MWMYPEEKTVIKVGNTEIPVHRVIFCHQSPVFYNIFSSTSKKSQESVFEIKNFRFEVAKQWWEFDTDDASDIRHMASEASVPVLASEMLPIAAEYRLDRSKVIAEKYLCADLTI
uniref:BTB domain-containing protein n=1 Tax=Strongyloides papillosus TaxID=174720 RepID=A0A0N5BM40_STREA